MKPTAKKRKQNIEEKFFTTCIKALNDEDEGDECAIVGKNIATKLRKMDFHQQIWAESLIQQILMKGLFKELTRNTVVEERASPSASTSYTPIPVDTDCNASTSSLLSTYYEDVGNSFQQLD